MSEKEIQEVLDQLSVLEPTPLESPQPASTALSTIRHKINQKETQPSYSFLSRFLSNGSQRRWATAVAILLIFVLAFSFPSVRAAASEFLGLFRVQKFAAITISPDQIALIENLAAEGFTPGVVNIKQEAGAQTPVDTLSEAQAMAGLAPRTLTSLGHPDNIHVLDGGSGNLTIDLAGTRAIMEATGSDPLLLPDSIDGARISIVAFPIVEQSWSEDEIWLLETTSPLVEYPEELADPIILAEAFLQVMGLDKDEAERLAQEIDWTSTLLLPLPSNTVTYQEIMIDGVTGMALQDIDSINSAIIWEKEGIIYLLQGKRAPEDLQALAVSLK